MDQAKKFNMFRDADFKIMDRNLYNSDIRFGYHLAKTKIRTAVRLQSSPDIVCRVSQGAEKAADDFLAHPEIWTNGALARDQHGRSVSSLAYDAIKWCALGRIRFHLGGSDNIDQVMNAVAEDLYGTKIENLNDSIDSSATKMARILRRISATLKTYC